MTEQKLGQTIQSIIGDYKTFLDEVFQNLTETGFSLDEFKELDHIAYRTESLESYEKIKKGLLEFSQNYSDKIFGGRPVLVCRLKKPLAYNSLVIESIEVLAPKRDNKFKEGLEHAEFVTKTALLEFREKHNNIPFNLDAYAREDNPELTVEFKNCAVKFHTQSLLQVRGM
ncbi:MAG: VOC family protein [Candidatus Moraniibacteriota bacterium]